MDTILNALSQSRLIGPLGFLALAITYLSASIASAPGRMKAAFSVGGVIFFGLAVASLVYGTVKAIDVGLVLGYVGVGIGLVTLAVATLSNSPRAGGAMLVVGLLLVAVAALLVHRAGLF